jgi:hypothetical protein
MQRRTRGEIEAENLVLYRELETIRDRLEDLLGGDDDDAHAGDGEESTNDGQDAEDED